MPSPLSIDTSKAVVAELALARGASIINDVTALRGDPEMVRVVAESGAGVVLMHMLGDPGTMQEDPRYDDVVGEILGFLDERIDWCESRGIPRSRIAVDPGIGFGKTFEHNLELLRNLEQFANLGCALLVGTSRKGFLGTLTGRAVSERMVASVVSSLAAGVAGAQVVRVHDVGGDGRRDPGLDGGPRMGRVHEWPGDRAHGREGRDGIGIGRAGPLAGPSPARRRPPPGRWPWPEGRPRTPGWLARPRRSARGPRRSSRPTPATWPPRPPSD